MIVTLIIKDLTGDLKMKSINLYYKQGELVREETDLSDVEIEFNDN